LSLKPAAVAHDAGLSPSTDQVIGFGRLLGRLALAGLIAGTLAGLFSVLVTERTIAPALRIEEARAAAADTQEHEDLFSRGTQVFGGFLGTLLAGLVLAVVFAVVFGAVRHRLPGRSDFVRVVLLAGIGFGVLALLPAVKVPANPPAVGNPGTVGTRTAIYGAVILSGIVAAMLVSALVSFLRSRSVSVPATTVAAVAMTAVGVALVLLLLPDSPGAIPADVPAAVVWDFRLASLGQLAVLWTALGLAGGWLVERVTAGLDGR
jgi:predicted cobalt transporter CbtA